MKDIQKSSTKLLSPANKHRIPVKSLRGWPVLGGHGASSPSLLAATTRARVPDTSEHHAAAGTAAGPSRASGLPLVSRGHISRVLGAQLFFSWQKQGNPKSGCEGTRRGQTPQSDGNPLKRHNGTHAGGRESQGHTDTLLQGSRSPFAVRGDSPP